MKIILNKSFLLAVGAAIGFVGATVGPDYFSFLADNRSEFRREYIESQKAATVVLDNLQKFADIAQGQGTITDVDKEKFRTNVRQLFTDVNDVGLRSPEIEQEVEAYTGAILDVQDVALRISGPLDAKAFVESFSKFIKTQKEFDEKAQAIQSSYLSFL